MMNPTIKVHFAPVEAGLSVKVDPALQVNICTRFILFQDSTRHVRLMMADSMALLLLSRRQQLCRPEEYTGC